MPAGGRFGPGRSGEYRFRIGKQFVHADPFFLWVFYGKCLFLLENYYKKETKGYKWLQSDNTRFLSIRQGFSAFSAVFYCKKGNGNKILW
jgi:hypothetical protein